MRPAPKPHPWYHKLDDRIDAHVFAKWSRDRGEQQITCQREIEWHQAADQNYLEEGARILELGELTVQFRRPFDLLAERRRWSSRDMAPKH